MINAATVSVAGLISYWPTPNEVELSQSSTPSLAHRRCTRDRSKPIVRRSANQQ